MASPERKRKIRFKPHDVEVLEEPGVNLLGIAQINNLYLPHECGGHGDCGTCRVVILEGLDELAPRTLDERDYCKRHPLKKNERLSCQLLLKEKNPSLKSPSHVTVLCPAGIREQEFIETDVN